MTDLLDFARGPLFLFTFVFMLLGLARLVFLRSRGLLRVRRRTPKRDVPWRKIVRNTAGWLVPVGHLARGSWFMGLVSFLFHVGLILVPVFLAEHILLWDRGLGVSWPSLPAGLADLLTLTTVAAAFLLLLFRSLSPAARALSGPGDYLLLMLLALPFVSGYFAGHPASSPLPYRTMLLIHVLSAELTFVLMPFTKLAHAVLFPFDRVSPEIFWRLVPGAGDRVAEAVRGSRKGAEA